MIISASPIAAEHVKMVEEQCGEHIHVFRNIDEASEVLKDAEILICSGQYSGESLERCDNLKFIFTTSAGVNRLPFDKLREKGALIANARGIHGTQIAEHVFGMMIIFSRGFYHTMRNQMQKSWKSFKAGELIGKTICIIGAGSIGSELARKAKAFYMRVIGLKKHPCKLENFDEVRGMDKFHDSLKEADYIVLAVPLTDETNGLIGKDEMKFMKPDAFFINISRGETVDEEALIETLKNGCIAGAGLDVFCEEPLPAESPLWEMENVIITPHMAGATPEYMKRAMNIFIENLKCYRQGKPLTTEVDYNLKY